MKIYLAGLGSHGLKLTQTVSKHSHLLLSYYDIYIYPLCLLEKLLGK